MQKFIVIILILIPLKNSAASDVKEEFKDYINSRITEVKESEDPSEKRELLNNLFLELNFAFDAAKESGLISEDDLTGLELFSQKVEEKYDELNGLNGYEKVNDKDLNEFANFTLQDFEQADTILTISLTTLLLIIILAILIF